MARNPRYDILFEPLAIGPVIAPNRFYQTPHATGMGRAMPNASATLRGIKAEGGWGVVCTEYCSIHPSADETPYAYLTLWDDEDVAQLALTSAAIHRHGSLAGVELWHGGFHCNNRGTREIALAPSAVSAEFVYPAQVREMDLDDIVRFRDWHRAAARRAVEAGFDIVYVYAGHEYLPFQFLSPRFNRRRDAYGGHLENRARLLRELIEDTREAVGDRAAVAVRLAIDELHGADGVESGGDGRKVIELLGELPDLWDITLGGGLGNDSCSARFSSEGFQERYAAIVKQHTSKPVVSVGRFTSPDTMAAQIRRGVQDFIGAARPSIADPFLPRKIDAGREDEIRECIGCNICRSANNEGAPLRCTQNPTMGEEWRRGWHPEYIPAAPRAASFLIVGGGPAGLEAALVLGRMGHRVTLAEAGDELGGRVLREASLPGLQNWLRVRDYRAQLLSRMENVAVYANSCLEAADVAEFGADQVVVACGSRWRRDALGHHLRQPLPVNSEENVYTPDDLFADVEIRGDVLVYDDDHYFIAGALAERLLEAGHRVQYVTPAACISSWSAMTNEQDFIQRRLLSMGIETVFGRVAVRLDKHCLVTRCLYRGESAALEFDNLLLVTSRAPADDLFRSLEAGTATRIGDCLVPSSIADAVYSGHRFAREFGRDAAELRPRREHSRLLPLQASREVSA
jgi:dimethylamine/trimethylamine dehydrogenase